jgi:molybdopterin molybdotransferase
MDDWRSKRVDNTLIRHDCMTTLISPAEADARISSLRNVFPATHCPLDIVAGRFLRQDILADHDFPPFDRVMMDGIAVRFADIKAGAKTFRICGTLAAGQAPIDLPVEKCSAIEVMTGCVLPTGADCILQCEWYRVENGCAEMVSLVQPQRGVFIHRRGSDHRAGEVLVRAGTRLGPVESSLAAACGCADLDVSHHVRIAVIGTGDELVPVDARPGPGQIRETNIAALSSALLLAGHPALESGRLRDEPLHLGDTLANVFARNNVVILTGGVSRGRHDYIPQIVTQLGGECVLHGIAQGPGKPMAVWSVRNGTVVFGLPGNPVSALVCLHRYVLPALNQWCGASAPARRTRRLACVVARQQALTLFLPVGEESNGDVRPAPVANSGDFAGLEGSSGFVEIAPGEGKFAEGGMVPYFPWAAR